MAVFLTLGGNAAGDGFLLAPAATTYEAEITLRTDAGTANVTLQANPDAAGLVFSQTAIMLSTTPSIVTVHATAQSGSRGDTIIQVLDGGTVVASFPVTSIKHPVVHFGGRFQARFATDPAYYNQNPMYSAAVDTVGPGWTWGLEGEPTFVPGTGNVPENLETPVGRVVRYNNPLALRSHAAPVASTVSSVSGDTAAGTETFAAGDPVIGQQVDLGTNTYLAGNNSPNPVDPAPEEIWDAAQEPMGLFELHIGTMFSGAAGVGPFTHKATTTDQMTRTPDSRPYAAGLVSASADLAALGLPNLTTFSETRIDQVVADYNAVPAGADKRNAARRVGHLLPRVSAAKSTAVQTANPGAFTSRAGTLQVGWSNKEVYTGYVDSNLAFNPGASSVISYLSGFGLFKFESHMFGFHSDELCGHHHGTLQAHVNMGGSYVGDPHTRTVDGSTYDFQGVGEFTLLRDGNHLEIQVRQTPVDAANPVTDGNTGLTVCVSVITAVAARVGKYQIALQPVDEWKRLQFYLDGSPADVPVEGMDLSGHHVSTFDADGESALRVDYADGTVLIATPAFWNAYGVWYLNVNVTNTRADEGIMGMIPERSWLPRLRDGSSVGAMPASIGDRYETLYRTFADSWRVTDTSSLFVYEGGDSTETFTDREWPAEKAPCDLKPQFQVPGGQRLEGMPVDKAEEICRGITIKDLYSSCVFDVATTGDESLARDYRVAQDLRLFGTTVQVTTHEAPTRGDRSPVELPPEQFLRSRAAMVVVASVSSLEADRPTPSGFVTFSVDGVPQKRPTAINARGVARITVRHLRPGEHAIRATYVGGGRYEHFSSASGVARHRVGDEQEPRDDGRSKDEKYRREGRHA